MRIDEIEVGKRYAYSSNPAVVDAPVQEVRVLRIDPISSGPGGSSRRTVRTPYVRFRDGTESYVPAKNIVETWQAHTERTKDTKGRLRKAESLERRLRTNLRALGVEAAVTVDEVLRVPLSVTIKIPFGVDGAAVERLADALELDDGEPE